MLTPIHNLQIVSIPLHYYFSVKLTPVIQLSNCLRKVKCTEDWFMLLCEIDSCEVKLVKIIEHATLTLKVTADLQWSVHFPNKQTLSKTNQLCNLPTIITFLSDLKAILIFLNQWKLCLGIVDTRFAPVISKCKGIFRDIAGIK